MTHLRKVMLEELQRRNFSQATIRAYIGAVERFTRFLGKPPDQHIREYQAHLLHKKKLQPDTVVAAGGHLTAGAEAAPSDTAGLSRIWSRYAM